MISKHQYVTKGCSVNVLSNQNPSNQSPQPSLNRRRYFEKISILSGNVGISSERNWSLNRKHRNFIEKYQSFIGKYWNLIWKYRNFIEKYRNLVGDIYLGILFRQSISRARNFDALSLSQTLYGRILIVNFDCFVWFDCCLFICLTQIDKNNEFAHHHNKILFLYDERKLISQQSIFGFLICFSYYFCVFFLHTISTSFEKTKLMIHQYPALFLYLIR